MSKFRDRFLDSMDSQLMSSSYLVLACMFYSESCHDAHAHYRKFSTLIQAWSMQCSNTTLLCDRHLKGKGMQGGNYFHVINIHQTNVKIRIGQFSKHANHGLDI